MGNIVGGLKRAKNGAGAGKNRTPDIPHAKRTICH